MSTSLFTLFRPLRQRVRCRTLWFGLLALLLVSTLFLFAAPPTSADSPVEGEGDTTHPLYANPSRAALSEAIASVKSGAEEASALGFTPCVDGMADEFPCHKVDLMAFMTLNDIGGSNTNDIWGWTDPEDGKEYALVGRTNGTSFVDISNPTAPIYLGQLLGHNGSSSSWRDVKVYQDHAFIVSEASGHGMQIFDLTQLRDVTDPPVTFSETAHYAGFGSAHNIVINEDSGYAYGVGTTTCGQGLDMVDISVPLNPTFAGCFSQDGYTHDAQCVNYEGPDADYADSEICLNSNEDTLTIVDVTDKANPVQVAREGYPNPGYTHQGWLTEDQRYFLQDDETDETGQGINTRTLIWDLLDLDNPVYMGHFDSGIPASDHNQYIKGNFAYQSNYASGLRILDISGIADAELETVAYFDVFPAHDNAGFDGSWSNYPYFDSGIVIVTSRTLGFMIVRPALEGDFSLEASPESLDLCLPEDAVYSLELASLEEFDQEVMLSVSGEPAGATVDFSVNPVIPAQPPAMSTLTIGTSGVNVGSYEIDIIGSAPTKTHTVTVGLNLTGMVGDDLMLVAPADMASNVSHTPIFEWMAVDQASGYQLEVATDIDFTTVVYNTTVVSTSHEATMSLAPNSTYYWRVRGINDCDTGEPSATFSFTTRPPAGQCAPGSNPMILFSDDFESGANGWTTGSDVGLNTWQLSSNDPHSGAYAYHADNTDNNNSESNQWLMSPAIELPLEQGPLTLQFFNFQDLQDDNQGCRDGGILEISTDGGNKWRPVTDEELLTDPYDGLMGSQYQNPLAGQRAWCGDPQDWLNSIVDINQFAGQTIHVRFHLGTDSFGGNSRWTIDDVVVQSCVVDEDEDDDGVEGEIEDLAPNEGDGNGDGMADSEQENVTSLPNQGSDDGYVTLAAPAGTTLVDVEAMTMPMTLPTDVNDMPQGLLSFSIQGIEPGAEVSVTLYLENDNSPLNSYWKYDEMSGHWTDYSDMVTYGNTMVGDQQVTTVTIMLVDGGMGDHDGLPNGTIVDPGGPTVDGIALSVSLANFDGQASADGEVFALLALLFVIAGGVVIHRQRFAA